MESWQINFSKWGEIMYFFFYYSLKVHTHNIEWEFRLEDWWVFSLQLFATFSSSTVCTPQTKDIYRVRKLENGCHEYGLLLHIWVSKTNLKKKRKIMQEVEKVNCGLPCQWLYPQGIIFCALIVYHLARKLDVMFSLKLDCSVLFELNILKCATIHL